MKGPLQKAKKKIYYYLDTGEADLETRITASSCDDWRHDAKR